MTTYESLMHNSAHSGEDLREYLPEDLGVTRQPLSALINGRAGVSATMALRLQAALGTSAKMWLGMQISYDRWEERKRRAPNVARIARSAKAA